MNPRDTWLWTKALARLDAGEPAEALTDEERDVLMYFGGASFLRARERRPMPTTSRGRVHTKMLRASDLRTSAATPIK